MSENPTKPCSKCGSIKELAAFGRDSHSRDGMRSQCRDCDKRYRASPSCRENQRAALKRYRESEGGRAVRSAYKVISRERYQTQRAAQNTVWKAIKRGTLQPWPACALPECNTHAPIEAHHADYSRPRDVVWLCRDHHRQLHVEHRSAEREK